MKKSSTRPKYNWEKSTCETGHVLDLARMKIELIRNLEKQSKDEFPWKLKITSHESSEQRANSKLVRLGDPVYSANFTLQQYLRESDEAELKVKAVWCAEGWLMGLMAKVNVFKGVSPL
jgi:hypothetical protein